MTADLLNTASFTSFDRALDLSFLGFSWVETTRIKANVTALTLYDLDFAAATTKLAAEAFVGAVNFDFSRTTQCFTHN